MKTIHDLVREFIATEGIKMTRDQSHALFLFADWLYKKQIEIQPIAQHEHDFSGRGIECSFPGCEETLF
jgi:hypothetical protein